MPSPNLPIEKGRFVLIERVAGMTSDERIREIILSIRSAGDVEGKIPLGLGTYHTKAENGNQIGFKLRQHPDRVHRVPTRPTLCRTPR